jgi:hypothetical protein
MTPQDAPTLSVFSITMLNVFVRADGFMTIRDPDSPPDVYVKETPGISCMQRDGQTIVQAYVLLGHDFARWMRRHYPDRARKLSLYPTDPAQRALLELLEADQ